MHDSLDAWAPMFFILGTIFIGAYIAPTVLGFFDKLKEKETKTEEVVTS